MTTTDHAAYHGPADTCHASMQASIDYMRPLCLELACLFMKIGSFYCKELQGV